MSNNVIKIFLFVLLLLAANFFLLQKGLWLYQDASYIYKTHEEVLRSLLSQFYLFSNSNYYLGYDVGLFGFNRIIPAFVQYVDYSIFSSGVAQVIYILSGYIVAFASFYLFSGIFFKGKNNRFIMSLLFVFSPLFFSLLPEEQIYMYASTPLFLYGFYNLFSKSRIRIRDILLITLSFFFTVQYLRFAELNVFIIVPYLAYLYFTKQIIFTLKKILILSISIFLLALPIIYSFGAQLLEHSQTAFSYATVFNQVSFTNNLYKAFTVFQFNNLITNGADLYVVVGILVYIILFFLLFIKMPKDNPGFYLLNLALILLGISFFSLSNIVGSNVYSLLIKFLPFLVNNSYYGLYVLNIPLILLLGILYERKVVASFVLPCLIIILSIFFLLSTGNIQLKKIDLSQIPKPYVEYFVSAYQGISEATQYIPGTCWRSAYMDKADIYEFCLNARLHYTPISDANPRLLSGLDYRLSEDLLYNVDVDNFRITDNLKNIVIPNDIVKRKLSNELYVDTKELTKINSLKISLNKNTNLALNNNPNFNFYSYKDKNNYDYFLYSPLALQDVNINNVFSTPVDIKKRPVFTDAKVAIEQSPQITYKIDPENPTKYYFKATLRNDKPFVLQFNQTYNTNWQIRWITKAEYEKQNCFDSKYFSITDNIRCQYSSGLLNLSDITYLNNPLLNESNHLRGNILGNMWTINPSEINNSLKNGNEIYGVIIYNKQIYFSWTIFVSIFSFILLVILMLMQELKNKYDNIKKK